MMVNTKELCARVVKYLTLGLVVAFCGLVLPRKSLKVDEVLTLALVSGSMMAILDMYMPVASNSLQRGVGLTLGAGLVGGVPIAK